jgi:hypothetical protein
LFEDDYDVKGLVGYPIGIMIIFGILILTEIL